MSDKKYSVEKGEYKGSPVITIFKEKEDGSKMFVVSFGKGKAEAILATIAEIKEFVGGNSEDLL